jgi:hypothetical protein
MTLFFLSILSISRFGGGALPIYTLSFDYMPVISSFASLPVCLLAASE